MDVDAWVWSHFSLEPSAQKLGLPLRLTCLVCRAEVTHVETESRLADHLRQNHIGGIWAEVGIYGLLSDADRLAAQSWTKEERRRRADGRPPGDWRKHELAVFFHRIGKTDEVMCKVCGHKTGGHFGRESRFTLTQHLSLAHPHLRPPDRSTSTRRKKASTESGDGDGANKAAEPVDRNKESEVPLGGAGGDFDLMLMASFEAEMKRKRMMASKSGDPDASSAAAGECEIPAETAGSSESVVARSKDGGGRSSRKRASSPADVVDASDAVLSLIRGASPPGGSGEEAKSEDVSRASSSLGDGASSRASSSSRQRSSSRAPSSSSSTSSVVPTLAESVKRRRTSLSLSERVTTAALTSASELRQRLIYRRGVIRRGFHKLVRKSAALWTDGRHTDFDREMVFCPRSDDVKGVEVRSSGSVGSSVDDSASGSIKGPDINAAWDSDSTIRIDSVFQLRPKIIPVASSSSSVAGASPTSFRETSSFLAFSTSSSSKSSAPAFPTVKHTIIGSFKQLSPNTFSCLLCAKRYRRLAKLASHVKAFHNSKPYACVKCNRKFLLNCHRLRHEEAAHEERRSSSNGASGKSVHECKTCRLTFRRDYSLKLHRCLVHKKSFRLKTQLISIDDPDDDDRNLIDSVTSLNSHESHPAAAAAAPPPSESIMCCNCEAVFVTEASFEKHREICSDAACDDDDDDASGSTDEATEDSMTEATEASRSSGVVDARPPALTARKNITKSSSTTVPKSILRVNTNISATAAVAAAAISPTITFAPSHPCPTCTKAFSSYSLLKRHVDASHNAKAILAARKIEGDSMTSCSACDDAFPSTPALVEHFTARHEDLEVVKCDWFSWSQDDDEWYQHSTPLVFHV